LSRRPLPFSLRVYKKMTSPLTFSDERARRLLGWAPRPVTENAGELVS